MPGLLLLAYLVIYPGFRVRNLGQMIVIDIGLTGFALFVAWWLYGGQGLSLQPDPLRHQLGRSS